MRVCVVGKGGREHALAVSLAREADVVVCPGNQGMELLGVTCSDTPPEAVEADLFVIGPEEPLVDGLADRLRAGGKRVFGPGADGARLEGSKAWMKELLVEAGVPTARHGSFTREEQAISFLRAMDPPYVVKTDGLAAGKGVLVTEDRSEAEDAVRRYMSGEAFGDAGRTVVIEEGLYGRELSVLAVCDGQRATPLPPARDHKRLLDGDAGPNTGGMGAYSPVPDADDVLVERVMDECVEPTLDALRRTGVDYRGVLYAGLMITADGPKVLEYNVRFGDPEAQAVLPRLGEGLLELLASAADGSLRVEPNVRDVASVTVVCATEGYPTTPRTGDPIEGLDEVVGLPGVEVFSAGVARDPMGRPVTAGGRVLAVTGLGGDLVAARDAAYAAVTRLRWEGMHFRRDIGATF